jgi:hypothetical protein
MTLFTRPTYGYKFKLTFTFGLPENRLYKSTFRRKIFCMTLTAHFPVLWSRANYEPVAYLADNIMFDANSIQQQFCFFILARFDRRKIVLHN